MKEHRVDGDPIVLTLRSGGEVTCDKDLIEKIEPDEVPYPEPAGGRRGGAQRRAGAGSLPFWTRLPTATSSRRCPRRTA